jgi:hypothetical protein
MQSQEDCPKTIEMKQWINLMLSANSTKALGISSGALCCHPYTLGFRFTNVQVNPSSDVT